MPAPAVRNLLLLGGGAFSPARLPGLQLWLAPESAVTLAAGMGAQFNSASSRYLSHAGNAVLLGGTTWWRSIWFYQDSVAVAQTLFSSRSGNDGLSLSINAAGAGAALVVGNGTTAATATDGTTFGTAAWHHAYVEFDGTNIGIAIDGGALTQAALGGSFSAGAGGLNVGANLTPLLYFDGRMQVFCGDNGVQTSNRVTLYNAGVPLTYAQMAAFYSSTFFCFELNEPTGARVDIGAGAYSLTSNNTVGTAAGTALNAVSQWNDLSAQANHVVQATQANKPVFRFAVAGGKSAIRLDGTNDHLAIASPAGMALGVLFTFFVVFRRGRISTTEGLLTVGAASGGREYGFVNTAETLRFAKPGTAAVAGNTGVTSLTAYNVGCVHYEGNNVSFFLNGAADGTPAFGVTFTDGNLVIGARSTTPTELFMGDIVEALVYSRVLSSPERRKVERYLSLKYGIAVV